MNAVRLTFDKPPREVRIPDALLQRPLEIIFLPLGPDERAPRHEAQRARLATFAGMWQGGELVREPQGDYEKRHEVR